MRGGSNNSKSSRFALFQQKRVCNDTNSKPTRRLSTIGRNYGQNAFLSVRPGKWKETKVSTSGVSLVSEGKIGFEKGREWLKSWEIEKNRFARNLLLVAGIANQRQ